MIARAEAVVGSKRGPSLLQPYRDLAKLLRKGSAYSDQVSWVFRGAPFVAFACYLTVCLWIWSAGTNVNGSWSGRGFMAWSQSRSAS